MILTPTTNSNRLNYCPKCGNGEIEVNSESRYSPLYKMNGVIFKYKCVHCETRWADLKKDFITTGTWRSK